MPTSPTPCSGSGAPRGRQWVYTGLHWDEKTPHLYAYVVPLDEATGRLNARKWFGGPQALRDMQTEFAAKVGQRHGLERGSRAARPSTSACAGITSW